MCTDESSTFFLRKWGLSMKNGGLIMSNMVLYLDLTIQHDGDIMWNS